MSSASTSDLQSLCELGQNHLMQMDYLQAESTLVHAEALALAASDFDTLARLYMPLQEARRQRRQRCGEGTVCLNLIAQHPHDSLNPADILQKFPHGQLLVAGWGTLQPALELRQLQAAQGLYVETFLAAAYPMGTSRVVVIAPLPDITLPPPTDRPLDTLLKLLPAHCIVLPESDLPPGPRPGTPQTYAHVMSLWEKLHAPFLAAADNTTDPLQKIDGYRRTLQVDYACELAHQRLSATAHALARQRRAAQNS